MKIVNHRLYHDDDTPVPFKESPNHSGIFRKLQYLVMHYTAGPSAEHSVNWLINPSAKASAHLVIGRDGSITQLVPFDTIAWHAGRSEWQGIVGLNSYSIGIELDNAGPLEKSGSGWRAWFGEIYPPEQVIEAIHKNESYMRAWQLYTPEQLYVALEVSALLVETYQLVDILGHDDIAPGRKSDPGPAFPMETFRSRLFGRADDSPDVNEYETTANLNIRIGPDTNFTTLPVSPLPRGTRLQATGQENGIWKEVDVVGEVKGVSDIRGWVHRGYIRPI